MVLVLLPGGTFWMGAQPLDADGRNYDPQADIDEGPVHEVELSAFFLSKYEMTQGQWQRLTGRNPSAFGPQTAQLDSERALSNSLLAAAPSGAGELGRLHGLAPARRA